MHSPWPTLDVLVRTLAVVLAAGALSACSDIYKPLETRIDATARALTLEVTLSERIATVGIAHVRVTLPVKTVDSLELRYGRTPSALDQSVKLDATQLLDGTLRTLILGLKQDTEYYAQVVASHGDEVTHSDKTTFITGALPNGLPPVTQITYHPDASYGGFTVGCTGAGFGDSVVWILDPDGDYVWAYPIADTPVAMCSRARLSYDGHHLWVGNVNMLTKKGALMRVSMDGMGDPLHFSLPGRHHDFAILPSGNIAYFAQANGGGLIGEDKHDIIMELDPNTGTSVELYDQKADFGALFGTDIAHTNYISYVPELQALSFSMRQISTIALVSYPQGRLLSTFGGPQTSYERMNWSVQHGHHLTADRLYVFANQGSPGDEANSRVLGYHYDQTTGAAVQTLEYVSGEGSITFGEVRQLPNHNLFVTYSNAGILQEINAEGHLVAEIRLGPVGYTEHRRSLYGPPPPYGE